MFTLSLAWLSGAVPGAFVLGKVPAAAPTRRCCVSMQPIWYGGDDSQLAHSADARPNDDEVAWTLSAHFGVRGFYDVADVSGQPGSSGRRDIYDFLENEYNINQHVQELAADVSALGGSAGDIYKQDYRHLPYKLRRGEVQVLSRWNMVSQKLTVSRVQCKVRVFTDGTACLTSCGKGPTLWRAWGGPWNVLYKDERHIMADGDQVSLDWQDPEAAVFTCLVASPMQPHHAPSFTEKEYAPQEYAQQVYAQQQLIQVGYAQEGWVQEGYAENGYAQQDLRALPEGWATDIDQASGARFYYNERSGVSQWEVPEP